MGVTCVAIAITAPVVFFIGSGIAGVGFGLAFLGSFRAVTPLAEPDDRAGLVTAIYIVGYLAFSIPALIAGVATTRFGLHTTAVVYSAALAVLAAVAVAVLLARGSGKSRRPAPAARTAPAADPAAPVERAS
jgi:MFS family permease